ncbi:MAG: hypothetical protein OH337_03550 [Candidatus Parvarchaeota archaeon]|nr:hypothetical protein [Candidatus Haiyanarchaeum thermophilum]
MRGSKMEMHKRFLVALVTAVFLSSLMPATFGQLENLPAPFITNGVFDAYVVVGAAGRVEDVIGAIELAAAFAQKATSPAVAGAGGAVIEVKTFSGTQDSEVPILSSGTGPTAGYEILPNYTYTLNDVNYTAVEEAKVTNITVDEYLKVTIPAQTVEHKAWIVNQDGETVSDIIGLTIRVAGTNFYVVNFTQNGNITLGESVEYDDVTIPWTSTIAGKEVAVEAVSADGKWAKVRVGTTVKLVNITTAVTVEDVTFVITNVINWGSYITADISLIASTERWEHNKEWPRDPRYIVDLSESGNVTLKNKNDIVLSDLGSFKGPAESWTFYYKERKDKMETANLTVEVGENSAPLSGSFEYSNGQWNCTAMPGMKLQRYNPDLQVWYDVECSAGINVTNEDMFRMVDADGSYAQFKVNNTTNTITSVGVIDKNGTVKILSLQDNNYTTSGGTTFTYASDTKLTFDAVGSIIKVTEKQQQQLGEYSIRYGVSGVYSGGVQLTGPLKYGGFLTFDGSVLKFTEPDGASWTVTFDKNGSAFYVKAYNLPANGTKSPYGSLFEWNEYFQDLKSPNAQSEGNLTITIPRKDAVCAIGQWIFTPLNLSLGEEKPVGNTTIKLADVTGVGGVRVNPVALGFAKQDIEMGAVADKPLIIVGGPAINRLAAEAFGVPYPSYGEASTIKPDHYKIAYATVRGKPAIVVAGWEARYTYCAARLVASYVLTGQPALTGVVQEGTC